MMRNIREYRGVNKAWKKNQDYESPLETTASDK